MNENDPKNFAWFVHEYRGALIGIVVALILLATGLSSLLLSIAIIILGAFIGFYVQNNKDKVKEILRGFIDKF